MQAHRQAAENTKVMTTTTRPTTTTTKVVVTTTAVTTPPTSAAPASATTTASASAYCPNFSAARAAGVIPSQRGESGYSSSAVTGTASPACEVGGYAFRWRRSPGRTRHVVRYSLFLDLGDSPAYKVGGVIA